MDSTVPDHLKQEQQALEAEIREAFKGVTREGGVSWSEGFAIDLCRSDEEYAAARASDKERAWEELVHDPAWHDEPGCWPFLDAVGFRYYLAPAMIRCAREARGEFLAQALDHPIYERELGALLTARESSAVSQFLRFMSRLCDSLGLDEFANEWRDVDLKWRGARSR